VLVAALTALGVSRQERYADASDPVDNLADYLIVSDCTLSQKSDRVSVVSLKDRSGWTKCERSWKYFKGGSCCPK